MHVIYFGTTNDIFDYVQVLDCMLVYRTVQIMYYVEVKQLISQSRVSKTMCYLSPYLSSANPGSTGWMFGFGLWGCHLDSLSANEK